MKRYTLLIILTLTSLLSRAQITIGGDVYGGGKQGAVNIGNATKTVTVVKYTADEASSYNTTNAEAIAAGTLTAVAEGDVKSVSGKENVTLTKTDSDATSVTITKKAVVRTVFGGGMNGRCYGQTNVTIEGGGVGAKKWTNTIHGGVFGAGDGSTAYVFGKENSVLVKGGTIYNNVYGGGNQADLMGCTKVTLQNGTYYGSVFGGARMANIYGHAYVNLDGANVPADSTLIIPTVYGGNDISGTISTSNDNSWDWTKAANIDISQIPITLRNSNVTKDYINSTWNAFICSTYPTDITRNNIFVGNLYSAGNGDYTYTNKTVTLVDTAAVEASNDYVAATYYTSEDQEVINRTKNVGDVKTEQVGTAATEETTKDFTNLSKPDIAKTYLNIQGGTFGYVYGGGNNATVTESTDIMVWNAHFDGTNNNAPVMTSIPESRKNDMGVLSSIFTITGTGDDAKATPSYQIDRIFGGNNKAAMAIQPHWYLAQGTFNNIYSGGNKGDMTCSTGILISIGSRSVYANNVYGGCRMADVRPKDNAGQDIKTIAKASLSSLKVTYDVDKKYTGLENTTYEFAEGYAARVYISEGHINNVYGGNDISGKVYFGTNVAIAGAISGNVYGGGNGSYAYTDNATLSTYPEYEDYYYNPGSSATEESSIEALNAYRPHVENTLLHIWGDEDQQPKLGADGTITATDADGNATTKEPVIVTGGIYCGGNSATIESTTDKTPTAKFEIGKNVIINKVYLGSNGENMVTKDILAKHASTVNLASGENCDYSIFDLTKKEIFAKYMEGCAVNILPTVTYDWTEGDDPHTYIGSLFGGGNVGSVTYANPIEINMPEGLIIYDRVVGGCNNADVDVIKDDNGVALNAAYEGGVTKANADNTQSKLTINMSSMLEPRELNVTMTNGFLSSAKLYWDVRNYYGLKSGSTEKQSVFVDDAGNKVEYATVPWLPYGANVFGGCYTSGHIAGDVTINVTKDIVSQTMLQQSTPMTSTVTTPCNASINWVHLGEYVFAKTMSIYGGGYGEKTYIAGNTHINLSGEARVINVLGGGDYGTIGCAKTDMHDACVGNTYVNVAEGMTDYGILDDAKGIDAYDAHLPYNVTKIYGGAYAGTIYGHTELRLDGGSYQQAYAGSCNADVADYTSMYLGTKETANSGYPYIYLYAFGGNDFGGYIGRDGTGATQDKVATDFTEEQIKGYHDFTDADGQAGYNKQTVRTTRYVEYNSGRVGYQYDSTKAPFDEKTGTGNFLSKEGSQRSSIYGGSYGSYDYDMKYISWNYLTDPSGANVQTDFDPNDLTKFHYPLAKEYIPELTGGITTNTYVNVPCASTNVNKDVIQRGILAGGRGIMERTGIVDAGQTYVYLHGATWLSRSANLSTDIYGGGYYSIVDKTKVDAESGCTNIIYGGSYGTSAVNLQSKDLLDIHYNSTRTEVNLYNGMDNSNLTIFGGGGYAGSTDTYVNLYGGQAYNVYGGSYNEGYCENTHVDVPASSTASVNAIFGGGYGNDVALPCDENYTNVTFSSPNAYVADYIYGGNNAKRAAAHTNVVINAPVKTSETGSYVSVCGAGNGACTIAGFTNVTLNNTAIVNNVYGGGRDGKVFGYYKNIDENARSYYDKDETYKYDPTESTSRHGYAGWKYASADNSDGSWEGTSLYEDSKPASGTSLYGYYTKSTVGGKDVYTACSSTATADGNTAYYKKISSTTIIVNKGATAQNVYGGGYGADATVAGSTRAHNHGGTIVGNLFGGGYSGNVVYQNIEEKATDNTVSPAVEVTLVKKKDGSTQESLNTAQVGNIYTYVCNFGGSVSSIYGGGYDGQVGSYHNDTYPAESRVEIGEENNSNYYGGNPIVLQSVYGGGYRGAIYGTAKIQMLNGHIGYSFKLGNTTDSIANGLGIYAENLKATTDDTHNLLKESGNVFGGGYGEGATTDHTIVNMLGGTIRNSLYGGGEIASIGVADLTAEQIADRSLRPSMTVAGSTQVNMYGGLVTNNIFGGGRGYAIDAYGNTQTGEIGYSDGFTFGSTNVNIYRGTVGTTQSIADGNGNVFGGGNIGYCYSFNGTKNSTDGYYYSNNQLTEDCKVVVSPNCRVTADAGVTINGHTYAKNEFVPIIDLNTLSNSDKMWENSLETQGITIGNAVFAGGNVSAGSDKVYANAKTIFGNATASVVDVYNKDLITLGDDGIGGLYGDGNLTFVDGYRELNVTNYGTDYYNLEASVTLDEYKRLSDRERAYFQLLYESKSQHTYSYYICLSTHTFNNVVYKKNQKLSSLPSSFTDEEKKNWSSTASKQNYDKEQTIEESAWSLMDATEQANWEQKGFCTLYAGRLMNTIQRADFCGIFGSRIVLKGAPDRVPSVVDYTDYTINRVDELSLNQGHKSCVNPSTENTTRSNYFGIYNVVNYLGGLTSDINFYDAVRTTDHDNTGGYQDAVDVDGTSKAYGTATYAEWKKAHLNDRKRNNGSSRNEVALASGVWLELVDKSSENSTTKTYGPITGVIQLDLINVATGEGGGYVYAKNIHGTRQNSNKNQVTLASTNSNAISNKLYTYTTIDADASGSYKMESSGNFVNSTKRIIDDCYPNSGSYAGSSAAPAHYWYIRGEYYVYDQYISAYTGSAQSYAKNISIPLTITPEARGRLTLSSIEKNHYAYWTCSDSELGTYKSSNEEGAIVVNGITYHKNDPISDWEYSRLTSAEQTKFFTARNVETYVCTDAVAYGGTTYNVGDALLRGAYDALPNVYISTQEYNKDNSTIAKGSSLTAAEYEALADNYKSYYAPLNSFFNVSNAVTHDKGFLLTFDWDNPDVWNDYYMKTASYEKPIRSSVYKTYKDGSETLYTYSPTFKCTTSGVFGQIDYQASDLIDATVYASENNVKAQTDANTQAKFESAHTAKESITIGDKYYVKGSCISATDYGKLTDANKLHFEDAYICSESYQASDADYYISGSVITKTDYDAMTTKYGATVGAEVQKRFTPAYICTSDGKWGGNVFTQGQNYKAIDICNLDSVERSNFTYNYDALDLLSEDFVPQESKDNMSYYQGDKLVDGSTIIADANQIPYAETQSIDYKAIYTGSGITLSKSVAVTHKDNTTATTDKLVAGDILTNKVYEDDLINEQFCYTPFVVNGDKYLVTADITGLYAAGDYINANEYATLDDANKAKVTAIDKEYYIVKNNFHKGNTWYSEGNSITQAVYDDLTSEQKGNVAIIKASQLPSIPKDNSTVKYYFATTKYTAVNSVTDLINKTTYSAGQNVDAGTVITADSYSTLKNEQKDFNIDGLIPTETSTLYVSRETDINQLSKDRIVTAVYWYEYIESDESGSSYETIRERHIVNIHIHFESGVPTIGDLIAPSVVLPGTAVGLNQPSVTKGAYEIVGGGWEMYTNESDAETHKNGIDYVNNNTPMYLYENNYYVSYYAKTYLGKTYSNSVPFTIANYHRMEDVMNHKTDDENDYMYLDEAVKSGKTPKVYIDNHTCTDATKTELNYLYDFYQKTMGNTTDLSNVKNCKGIDFILQSDVKPTVKPTDSWTSIGETGNCFEGSLHGDGHTITGLDHSLFNYFCGNIYNIGVTGSYTGAGIADNGEGTATNCWIATTDTPTTGVHPIFGGNAGQVNNCYYYENNKYKTDDMAAAWTVNAMPLKAFVDGEVAFNLNSYYLRARKNINSFSGTAEYTDNYLTLKANGNVNTAKNEETGEMENVTSSVSYSSTEPVYSYGGSKYGYVERRYVDGDFIYADGSIPQNDNIRKTGLTYYPIYPDDYIYFGQKLTYGVLSGTSADSHVNYPVAVNRVTDTNDESKNTKILATNVVDANRVYRAPGYYKSKDMDTVYFNKPAVFKDTYTLASGNLFGATSAINVYKNLTAIDFTGYKDDSYTDGSKLSKFYTPVLDYDSLTAFTTSGITRNLLVYADPINDKPSYSVLKTALPEATFSFNASGEYNEVAIPTDAASVKGHIVDLTNDGFVATRDHYLVDEEAFNCPISYKFGKDSEDRNCYMWYQRKPKLEKYVDASKGWEAISLPFTADLVSTQTKGEITHFYSNGSTYTKDCDSGHEYWLREYKGISSTEEVSGKTIAYSTFNYPSAVTGVTKKVSNDFLWDYYYSHDNSDDTIDKDANNDDYPTTDDGKYTYYKNERTYTGYPYFTVAVPYIVGFPGSRYYEFDLSGSFKPDNRANSIDKIAAQTISFVSPAETTINVSDDELSTATVTEGNYCYIPNYMDNDIATGSFVLNSIGSSFDKTTEVQSAVPFRPYFTVAPTPAKTRTVGTKAIDSIVITSVGFDKGLDDNQQSVDGQLHIYAKKGAIVVESTLKTEQTITISNVSGFTVKSFKINNGETIETPINPAGVYIVNHKKFYVK